MMEWGFDLHLGEGVGNDDVACDNSPSIVHPPSIFISCVSPFFPPRLSKTHEPIACRGRCDRPTGQPSPSTGAGGGGGGRGTETSSPRGATREMLSENIRRVPTAAHVADGPPRTESHRGIRRRHRALSSLRRGSVVHEKDPCLRGMAPPPSDIDPNHISEPIGRVGMDTNSFARAVGVSRAADCQGDYARCILRLRAVDECDSWRGMGGDGG
jgi:hypothetical protein